MKILSVANDNRKKCFIIATRRSTYTFPYARLETKPSPDNRITAVAVDRELAREAFTNILQSGAEGTVHIDQVLEYNRDPDFMREAILYRLTLEARKGVEKSSLGVRQICRRLGTSTSQYYRLVDQTNTRKSVDQMLALLSILDCEVEFMVHARSA